MSAGDPLAATSRPSGLLGTRFGHVRRSIGVAPATRATCPSRWAARVGAECPLELDVRRRRVAARGGPAPVPAMKPRRPRGDRCSCPTRSGRRRGRVRGPVSRPSQANPSRAGSRIAAGSTPLALAEHGTGASNRDAQVVQELGVRLVDGALPVGGDRTARLASTARNPSTAGISDSSGTVAVAVNPARSTCRVHGALRQRVGLAPRQPEFVEHLDGLPGSLAVARDFVGSRSSPSGQLMSGRSTMRMCSWS